MDCKGTLVPSIPKSLTKQVQNSLQHLDQDALQPCSTQIGMPLSRNCENELILMAIIFGLTKETLSPDSLFLAMDTAKKICRRAGISDKKMKTIVESYMEFADIITETNPLRCLF